MPDDHSSTTLVHVAGPCLIYGSIQRQRCSWCGFVIVDDDLSRMAVAIAPCKRCKIPYMEGQHDERVGYCIVDNEIAQPHDFERPNAPGGFAFEAFIEVTMAGGFRATSIVEVEMLDERTVKIPPNCCMDLPPELTGEKESHLQPTSTDSVDPS